MKTQIEGEQSRRGPVVPGKQEDGQGFMSQLLSFHLLLVKQHFPITLFFFSE